MKKPTFYSVFIALSFTLFLAPVHVRSQDQQAMYFQLAYMKVKPGKYADYMKIEKEIWKPIHQERIKKGQSTGWFMYEVLYPSGTEAEYDFVIINAVNSWNGIEHMYDGYMEMAKKILTKDQLSFMEKTNETRDMVKVELWAFNDGIFDTQDIAPKYLVTNFMKIRDGNWQEYMDLEINLAKPVHQEDINTGGRAGWAVYGLVLPYSDNRLYDAAAVDFYHTWDQYGNSDTSDIWKKIHPEKGESYIARQIENTRSLVKQDVLYLVDYVD